MVVPRGGAGPKEGGSLSRACRVQNRHVDTSWKRETVLRTAVASNLLSVRGRTPQEQTAFPNSVQPLHVTTQSLSAQAFMRVGILMMTRGHCHDLPETRRLHVTLREV